MCTPCKKAWPETQNNVATGQRPPKKGETVNVERLSNVTSPATDNNNDTYETFGSESDAVNSETIEHENLLDKVIKSHRIWNRLKKGQLSLR